MDATRKGKIATLPAKIREEVNRRLHDGEQAKNILPWLNANEEVLRVLDEKWGEEPVSASNLSEWRKGGFQDWLERNEKVEALKTLSNFSLQLAQAAGGDITKGAAAVAGGKMLELVETVASADAEGYDKVVNAITALRTTEINQRRTDQRDIVLKQRDRALALEEKRFQRQTAELFIKFYKDRRAKEIIERKGDHEVQVKDLVGVIFGEKPG